MSDLSNIIRGVCEEKGLKYEDVIIAIEFSLAAAYRKDYGNKNQNIKVKFNPETGQSEIEDVKLVVEDLPEDFFENEEKRKEGEINEVIDENGDVVEERKFYPRTEIQLSDAQLIKKNVKVGDEIKMDLKEPDGYGRMASQTAKQVIIQKIREMEREMIYNEFKEKEFEVVNGVVQRYENGNVLIDLGKAIGIMPHGEQVLGERYNTGDRIKIYIKSVTLETRGPRIILSRISEEIVKALFYMEIPELSSGIIELRAIARTAGSRLKVAVSAEVDNIDPIGSCVGQKGARIQTIIGELNGEKIDIIEYNENPIRFVANALSPAKTIEVKIDEERKEADVTVDKDQFSLAIGKRGENIRLASALTGYKIKIYEENAKEEGIKNAGVKENKEEIKDEEVDDENIEDKKGNAVEKIEEVEVKDKDSDKKKEKKVVTKQKKVNKKKVNKKEKKIKKDK